MASEGQRARKVIVTGARTGVGLEISLAFLRKGDQVVLNSREITVQKTEEHAQKELDGYVKANKAFLIQKDVTKVPENRSLIEEGVKALGGSLDLLVNNAGRAAAGVTFEEITPEIWQEQTALNLDAAFYSIQAAIPHLKKSKGSIVNISSIAGIRPTPSVIPYSVSKAGMDSLTKAVAVEYASEGVRCNSINPGVIGTPFHEHSGTSTEDKKEMLEQSAPAHPLQRTGRTTDIAPLTLFLADDVAAAWITGQIIVVDGGKLLPQ